MLGQLMQTTETPVLLGARTLHTTDFWTSPRGNVVAVRDPELNVMSAAYNALGQRLSSADPDQGSWIFTNDAFGALITQTDSRSVVTTVTGRDSLGRMTDRTEVPPVTPPAGLANETVADHWAYDPTNGKGQLDYQQRRRGSSRTNPGSNPEVWRETYTYESLTSRPSTTTTIISEGTPQTLVTSLHYDSSGRMDQVTYPSNLKVKRSFTSYGQLASLSNADTSVEYWEATAENEWGHVTGETYLNGGIVGAHEDFHGTGQTYKLRWTGGAADQFTYAYDSFGNLAKQTRAAPGANNAETYAYDPLQRLTGATRTTGAGVTYDYKKSGNISYKSDYSTATANSYTYGTNGCGPHGVSQVALSAGIGGGTATYSCDTNGNIIAGSAVTSATYDAENRPRTIAKALIVPGAPPCRKSSDTIFCDRFEIVPAGSVPGSTTWSYATSGDRYAENSSAGTRLFGPNSYERLGNVHKHELGPILVTRTGSVDTVAVLLRDRLGSTLATIDGSGVNRRAYDAFGKTRNGDFGDRINGTLNLPNTVHGFTEHTHADDVALIHMKGRVYDYKLGRFLSVDPLIQDATSTQSTNPYTYILNNPLSGVDPTGYARVGSDTRSVCSKSPGACINGSVTAVGSLGGFGESSTTLVTPLPSISNGVISVGGLTGPGAQKSLTTEASNAGSSNSDVVGVAPWQGVLNYMGQQAGDAGSERDRYMTEASKLSPDDGDGRRELKQQSRERTPRSVRDVIEAQRPDLGPKPGSGGSANVSNPKANVGGTALKVVGRGFVLVSAGVSVYEVATSTDKPRSLARQGGIWGGAAAGGEIGAWGGSTVWPGVGTVVGGVVGAGVGGYLGDEAVYKIYNYFSPEQEN